MDAATENAPASPAARFLAGLQAGMMAVIVMLGWLGVSALWQRHTFWSAPNQMATLFRGGSTIPPGFGPYTASGIAVYVVSYCLLGGVVALAAPRRLTVVGLMLTGVVVAVGWGILLVCVVRRPLRPLLR